MLVLFVPPVPFLLWHDKICVLWKILLCWSVVVKAKLNLEAKFLIRLSILIYGCWILFATEKMRLWIQTAQMSFTRYVSGLTITDGMSPGLNPWSPERRTWRDWISHQAWEHHVILRENRPCSGLLEIMATLLNGSDLDSWQLIMDEWMENCRVWVTVLNRHVSLSVQRCELTSSTPQYIN